MSYPPSISAQCLTLYDAYNQIPILLADSFIGWSHSDGGDECGKMQKKNWLQGIGQRKIDLLLSDSIEEEEERKKKKSIEEIRWRMSDDKRRRRWAQL